jgi:hypothetical protein
VLHTDTDVIVRVKTQAVLDIDEGVTLLRQIPAEGPSMMNR